MLGVRLRVPVVAAALISNLGSGYALDPNFSFAIKQVDCTIHLKKEVLDCPALWRNIVRIVRTLNNG
jgi:hypothetical protein